MEKGSAEKKALLSQWFDHYCEISIAWIVRFNADSKQGCKTAGKAFSVRS